MAAPATDTLGMEFEVFLSFHGPDTRDTFTSCLYKFMVERGIRVFKDDKELRVGQKIKELFQALDNTQIYIPIFSKHFASSSWCLREVAHMVDCTSKSDGKKQILPVFFNVEPRDVKLETGLYRDALPKHLVDHGPDEVKRWGDALAEVPTRVGWKLEGQEYGELIVSIVQEVQLKLKVEQQSLPDHLVKVDDQEAIEELLDFNSDGVRFIIIHGTGGIGKSTLAKVIFNRFLSEFDCSSFLEDVQGLSQRHGLLHVQKKLLSDTLGLTSVDGIYDTNNGINRIRKGLSNKKVMVVVDNVNEREQLENLVGNYKWFGSGSRIIITTRDIRTIAYCQIQPSYYMYYPIKEMPMDRAIQLFSKHAFRSDTPPKDWHDFSAEVISNVGRLPLTLEVVGSLFASTDKSKWRETLKDLKQVPCRKVQDTLMISFNKLDHRKKEILLDIACFCIGEYKTHAYYMWDDFGYSPGSAIDDLLLMSLIKIDVNNKFWMHDEVRDLGRYIVKEENFEDVGKRRWVWIDENTLNVLRSNEEKPAVRALSLGISHDFTPQELARFPNLRFLGGERMNFIGNFKNLLPKLRWLSWRRCPLNLRAKNLHLVELVTLDLSWSSITHKWSGWRQIKMAKRLKVLNLACCAQLTKTPDFSNFGELEKLILYMCVRLATIDYSIGKMKLLSTLDLRECHSLQMLPKEIGSLECLSEISLTPRDKQIELPETLGNLKSMTKFEIKYIHYEEHFFFRSRPGYFVQLPYSIGRLTCLTHLSLQGCLPIQELPNSIGNLKSLIELDITESSIHALPDSIGNLKRLKVIKMGRSSIQTVPCALGQVETLEVLDVSDCWNIEDEIPWQMWSLPRLRTLELQGTKIFTLPQKISGFFNLQTLKISSKIPWPCPLPELPSSLKFLRAEVDKLNVLPDLSNLVHLDHLHLIGPIIGSFSEDVLRSILPQEEMPFIHRLPRSLSTLILWYFPQLPDFSDLTSLSDLTIQDCTMPYIPSLNFLERLTKLKIGCCRSLERTPDLSPLKRLEELDLAGLPKLAVIPGLGELESLKVLHISSCPEIEQLPDLSKLVSLKKAKVSNCRSLQRLPDLPAFTKLTTDWMPREYEEDAIASTVSDLPSDSPSMQSEPSPEESAGEEKGQRKSWRQVFRVLSCCLCLRAMYAALHGGEPSLRT